jgi:site-specific recombinase XerD
LASDIKDLEIYLDRFYGLGLFNANLQHLGAYREHLTKLNKSTATIKRRVASMRKLYKFLYVEGAIASNIAQNLEAPKLHRTTGVTPVFEKSDLVEVMESFDRNHLVECRNLLAISTMYYTACRVGALVQIKVEDLRRLPSHYEITLHEKRGMLHTVVSHPELTELLDHFLNISDITEGYLFLRSRKGWNKFMDEPITQRALLKMIKRTCSNLCLDTIYGNHSLRASAITNHLSNGGKLQEAQKLACHRSADMTSMYNRDDKVIKLEEVLRLTM